MGYRIYTVDAFSEGPFAGNPAGVCLLGDRKPDSWLQGVAAEMNLSETAFLVRRADCWSLRWFTPRTEVELCGHATLASAHVLWETGELPGGARAAFDTLSGMLYADRGDGWIRMDFPAEPAAPADGGDVLARALGARPAYVGRNRFDYLVELDSEESVCALAPDFALLRTIDARGFIVTARSSSSDYDFISRFFAPAVGVDEDPVTGSAHCCLGPHWGARLGTTVLAGYQASRRGGVVRVVLNGDRILLCGRAVTILRGEVVI